MMSRQGLCKLHFHIRPLACSSSPDLDITGHQPWLQWSMTEDEWRQYQDEYADYLDSIKDYEYA